MIERSFDFSKPHPYYRYGRMSDEKQNPRSPEQQFDTIETTKSRCGYDHWVYRGDYRDDGRSGRFVHKRRPGFSQLLEDIQTGRIKPGSVILVDTIERWGRAKKMKAIRDELFRKYGIVVLVANNNFADPTNATGEIVACVEDMRAWSENVKKAHDVLRGKIDAARQKRWPGGPPPVGYKVKVQQETRSIRSGREIVNHYSVLVPNPKNKKLPQRIFALAYEHGWGPDRITKTLNLDKDLVASFGKMSRATVAYVMDNPIYGGTLRYNRHATDVDDDCYISQSNADDEVVYVDDFCKAIVEKKIVQQVRADMKRRRDTRGAVSEAKTCADDDVVLLGCGVSVKYPLAGLVRCGCCGAAMRAIASGAQDDTAASYYYWRCPNTSDGRCQNTEYLRGPWLWEEVCRSINQELFPGFNTADGPPPDAVEALCEEVRHALTSRHNRAQVERPQKEVELVEIENQLAGWRTSLSNPQLSSVLRQDIEADYERTAARKVALEGELETLGTSIAHIEASVTPAIVVDKIRRLADVLADTNAADLNVELSYHIESIKVFPQGRVTIHFNRLGVLAGSAYKLYEAKEQIEVLPGSDLFRIKPRALSRRKTTGALGQSPLARPTGMMQEVAVPEKWSNVVSLQQPPIVYPYQEHAHAIAMRRLQGATHAVLCEEFNMTPATVRKSLKYAKDVLGVDLSGLANKMARANWAEVNASEVARRKALGMSTVELAEYFGKSDTTIRTALQHAEKSAHRSRG